MSREIVVLTRSLPQHRLGGMEIISWDLAKEFVRQGCSVRVITTSFPDGRGEFEVDGVRVVPIGSAPPGRYSRAWWSGSAEYFAMHCMASTGAVLSVSAAGYGLLPIRQRLEGVPFVMQAHGTSWREIMSKWQSRRLRQIAASIVNCLWLPRDLLAYRKFDFVVAVGEAVYASLKSSPICWFSRPGSITLVNNGVERSIFHPDRAARREIRDALGVPEDTPVFISANRLHPQKGTLNCLKALAGKGQRFLDFRYVIAGGGPERDQLDVAVRRLGLAKQVRFLGQIARTDLARWLQGSDAFLFLTERQEGLPLNVLEALGCGIPIVLSGDLQIFESPAIHRVNPRDPEDICGVLFALLNKHETLDGHVDLPSRFELSYAAREYISLFDLDRPVGGGASRHALHTS